MALEEALTAELFLEKSSVLIKSPLNPGDAASFAHPPLVMGHQNHTTLQDRDRGALRGAQRRAEAQERVGSVKVHSP